MEAKISVVESTTDGNKIIRIGTRDSELAMKQTSIVTDMLKSYYPNFSFEIESMKTLGDKILNVSLSKIGSKALFTKELEVALETRQVDLVVHSLKDLPTTLPQGLVIGAVCKRENPSDAVIVHPKHKGNLLGSLPANSVVGTSSLRRIAQLKRRYNHLIFENIRGNLNTRLRKLKEENKYDAIILAASGIIRLGWQSLISQYLDYNDCMYAVGQGALAIECRDNDAFVLDLLSPLVNSTTLTCVCAERSLMRTLEGGCSVPLAVKCDILDDKLTLQGGVWSLDGTQELIESLSCSLINSSKSDLATSNGDDCLDVDSLEPSSKRRKVIPHSYCGLHVPNILKEEMFSAHNLGVNLAQLLLGKGAKKILDDAKSENNLPANIHPSKVAVDNGLVSVKD